MTKRNEYRLLTGALCAFVGPLCAIDGCLIYDAMHPKSNMRMTIVQMDWPEPDTGPPVAPPRPRPSPYHTDIVFVP